MKAKEFVTRKQTLGEFAETNRKDLERMADYILGRWKAPNDVGREDVVQELLFECWRRRSRFDPTRGKTPEQYLSWNAIGHAKRQVHKARRAKGDRDHGRFDVLTATGDVESEIGDVPDDSEETEVMRRDRLRQLLAGCKDAREAICLVVFFEEEDTRAAGDRIYRDRKLRRQCRVKSASEARKVVKQTVQEHACR